MKGKLRGRKGQFYLIATLLVAIVFVAATITTYSIIRTSPFQNPPKILNAIEEMNLAIKRIMEFTSGYYGSILQVTGNATYANALAANYLQSGFTNLAKIHPDWNPSFSLDYSNVSTLWYAPSSYSLGNVSVTYDISGLGIYGIVYRTSSVLKVDVISSADASQAQVLVTREGNMPDLTLGIDNFLFYSYDYDELKWTLKPPALDPVAFSNGTYVLELPTGVSSDAYMMQVIDTRGMMATVSSFSQTTYTFSWDPLYQSLTKDTIAVEVLQNGTLRWLGQNFQMSTLARPIPPIPVKAFHVNQTIDGVNREVAFQVEDWASHYQVPLGIASSVSVFTNRHMLVFLVNHHVQNVTLWWDGRDTAEQTSYATTNKYFTVDTVQRTLTNGILTLKMDFSGSGSTFKVISTLGTTTGTAEFMRINNEVAHYGSAEPNYAVSSGSVRVVVQHEVEWRGDGAPDCPNVYAQIVLTLPANATYYTYALRFIFVNSVQSRTITDLSAIKLSVSTGSQRTENGTSGGYPISSSDTGLFYNRTSLSFQTGWAHHWSEFISGSSGAGIMFTDNANRKLYIFDSEGNKRGALNVVSSGRVIEFNPVTQSLSWATPAAVYSRCGQDGGYPASNAIDGDTGTYWLHSTSENHWIILDMGQTRDISQIGIYQSSTASNRWGYQNNVEVYVSNDPNNWGSAVWTGRLDLGSNWQYSGTFSATGQYVKLVSKSTSSSQRLYEVQVKYPLDVTWHGAVVTFNNDPMNTIYPTSGNIGLWVMVEYPPRILIPTNKSVSITVTSSPSGSGYVIVDGNATTTPATFNWTIGSNHTLQALSPVAGPAGTQYVWTGWSDGGAQTHNYFVPDSNATVIANYKTQYQVSFAVSPSGSGTTAPSGTDVWEDAGVIPISATANSGYAFSSWSATGSITIANPLSASTTATINGPGTITANFVVSTTIKLFPMGDGNYRDLSYFGDTRNWRCVDEQTADDDTTYVYRSSSSSNYIRDTYATQDTSASGTINSVTIYIRCRYSGGSATPNARTVVRISGTDYVGTDIILTTSWATYSTTYTTNPAGGAWTWAAINALECGVDLRRTIGGGEVRCTQVYIEVNYTP